MLSNMLFRLKNEIEIVGDQVEKHKTAKESLKKLNETYKKQIELVREESKLRLEVFSCNLIPTLYSFTSSGRAVEKTGVNGWLQ